jgi:branched-chain amino acid transport system permease protein
MAPFPCSPVFLVLGLKTTGNFWAALIVAPIVTAFFGIILERFFIRKVHAFGHIGEMILTVGISLILLAAVKIFWGTENLPVKAPPILEGLA